MKVRGYALNRFRHMRLHGSWRKKVQYANDFVRVMTENGVELLDLAPGYRRKQDYQLAIQGVSD